MTSVNALFLQNPTIAAITMVKITTLTGNITGNPVLEGFCPLRTDINTLNTLAKYTYQGAACTDNIYKTVSVPALTLTGNVGYAITPDAVASLALSK